MKFSRRVNFANYAILKKSQNLSDANNIKCREYNMTRKLSDLHYVNNKERTSLLPLKRLQSHIFYSSEAMSWSSSLGTSRNP